MELNRPDVDVTGQYRTTSDFVAQREYAEEQQKKADDIGGFELFKESMNVNGTLANVLTFLDIREQAVRPDPNFVYDEEKLRFDIEEVGLPAEWATEMAHTVSEEHRQRKLGHLMTRKDSLERIFSTGGRGLAAYLAGAVADPVALAADFAAAPVALGVQAARVKKGQELASNMGRAERAGRVAGYGAGMNAAVGAAQGLSDPEYDATQLFTDAMAGAAFSVLFDTSGIIKAGEKAEFSQNLKKQREALQGGPDDSAGAARDPKNPEDNTLFAPERGAHDEREIILANLERGEGVGYYSGIRFDMSNQANKETDIEARTLLRMASGDEVGIRDGGVNEHGFIQRATTGNMRRSAAFKRDWKAAAEGFLKDSGRMLKTYSYDGMDEFGHRVGRAMKGFADDDPNVQKAVAALKKSNEEIRQAAIKAGVKGADGMNVQNYLSRIFRFDVRELIADRLKNDPDKLGTLSQLFAAGLRSGFRNVGREIDEAATGRVSKHLAELVLMKRGLPAGMRDVSELKMDYIDEVLKESGIDQDVIDDIMFKFQDAKPGKDAPKADRLKHRLEMDETVSIKLKDGSELSLADLYETNAERLTDNYMHEMSGRIALAEMGFKDAEDFMKLARRYNEEGKLSDQGFRAAEIFYKSALGKQIDNDVNSTLHKAIRLGMSWNVLRGLSGIALSMVAETGSIIGQVGVRAAFQNLPTLRQMRSAIKNGHFDDEVSRAFADMAGAGTVSVRSSVSSRPDHFNAPSFSDGAQTKTGKVMSAVDRTTQSASQMNLMFSGMGPINDIQQQWLMKAFMGKTYRHLMSGGKSKAWTKRLRSYGISASDEKALRKFFDTGVEVDKRGVITKWDNTKMDPELYDRFSVSLNRIGRHAVQDLDAGALPWWMHKMMGKMVMQFRNYSVGAYTRQTLYGVAHADATAAAMQAWSFGFASAAYMARMHLMYGDQPDRMEEAMSDSMIAKNAWAMTAQASVVPMMVDTALDAMAQPKAFGYNRGSGNATDFLGGIPLVDLGMRMKRLGPTLARGVDPTQEITESDLRSAFGLMWFSKFPVFLAGQKALINAADLPNEWETENN